MFVGVGRPGRGGDCLFGLIYAHDAYTVLYDDGYVVCGGGRRRRIGRRRASARVRSPYAGTRARRTIARSRYAGTSVVVASFRSAGGARVVVHSHIDCFI